MVKWCALAFLVSAAAVADDKQPDLNATYSVTLTLAQWRAIAATIQRSPIMTAQEAAALNDAIGQQVDAQLKAKSKK